MPNFIKIRPVAAELLQADRQSQMKKPVVAFRNFANAPKIQSVNAVQGNNRCLF